MFEYASVSASAYDPTTLVAQDQRAGGDGWEVVAIVATGGDVTAFLRRSAGGEATAEAGDPTGEMELVGATAAEEVAVEAPETAAAGEGWAGGEVAAADAALTDAGAEATDGVDSATDVIDVVEVTEVPAAEAAAAGAAAAGEAAAPSPSRPGGPSPRTRPTTPRPRPRRSPSSPPEPRPRPPSPWRPSRRPLRRPSPRRPGSRPHPSSRRRPAGTRIPRTATRCATGTATQWTEHVARQGQTYTDPPVA